MWIFLGLVMALMVSGDQEDKIISRLVNEDVLLPCICENISLLAIFTWQKVNPNTGIISLKSINDTYRGRVKLFLNESINNCSLLLLKITAEDEGKYQCNYHTASDGFQHKHVDLHIVDQKTSVQPQQATFWIYIIVPIVLALGLSLGLCLLWNVARRRKRGYAKTESVEIVSVENPLFSRGG